jgi:hypothetical protein
MPLSVLFLTILILITPTVSHPTQLPVLNSPLHHNHHSPESLFNVFRGSFVHGHYLLIPKVDFNEIF